MFSLRSWWKANQRKMESELLGVQQHYFTCKLFANMPHNMSMSCLMIAAFKWTKKSINAALITNDMLKL